jgi:hypothetical protein
VQITAALHTYAASEVFQNRNTRIMEMIISGCFAIVGLTFMFLNLAVINTKTTINKWTNEFLQSGRIKSGDVSQLRTACSFDYLTNLTLDIDSSNKFRVLRSNKIRDKIREYRLLTKMRNYSVIALVILVGLIYLFYMN